MPAPSTLPALSTLPCPQPERAGSAGALPLARCGAVEGEQAADSQVTPEDSPPAAGVAQSPADAPGGELVVASAVVGVQRRGCAAVARRRLERRQAEARARLAAREAEERGKRTARRMTRWGGEAAVKLQCSWRRRLARQALGQLQLERRQAEARSRLATREAEERGKRAARQAEQLKGKQARGRGGTAAAAVTVQCAWRRRTAMRAVVVLRDQVWWQQEMVALGSLLEATPAFGALQHWRCTMEWGEAGWRGALGSAGALSRAAEARSWARVWLAELRTASVAEERLARRVARAAVGRRQAAMRVQAVWRGTAVRRAAEQVVEDARDEEEREACEEARSQLSSAARRAGYRLAGRFQAWETIEAQLARERAARAEAWVMRKGATLETAAEARRAGARAAKGLRQSLMKVAERHADGEVVRRRRLVHEKAEANLQAARRRWQRDQAAGGLEGWGMGDGVSDEERRWYAFRHDATRQRDGVRRGA